MARSVLVLSDIFGMCPGLKRLQADLRQAGATLHFLDPYQGKLQHFANEAEAYAAYSTQCGHDSYAHIAKQALQNTLQPLELVIGFSAGASALWRALAQANHKHVKQAILFYPGQIHQYLRLTPQVPTQVIFGNDEPHFAVADICAQLKQKPAVSACHTAYSHGFMNPASAAFSQAGYQYYRDSLRGMLA